LWGLTISPGVLAIADEAIEYRYFLLQRIRSLLALSGHTETISYLSAFGVKRTCRARGRRINRSLLTRTGHGGAEIPQCAVSWRTVV
jgi:hypothetical protein